MGDENYFLIQNVTCSFLLVTVLGASLFAEFQISNLRACMYVGVCGGWVGSNDPYENIFICFIRNDKMPAQAELLDVGESGARTVTSAHFMRPPSNAATGLLDKSRYIVLVNST
jgi:hypothetical protein